MRPTGATSLTGHVGSNEQNEPSTSRGLHTPFKSVLPRHPDYADSRDSFIGALDLVRPKVEGTHSVDLNGHIGLHDENDCKIISRDMYLYKESSIKQATAAHHLKMLNSHLEHNEPPIGLLNPITGALKKSISVPFSEDPDFLLQMTEITRKFSLDIACKLAHFWELRQSQLRSEVRSIKDTIYAKSSQLSTKEYDIFQSRMRNTENTIGWEKRKMAKTREWKLNRFGKRPLEKQKTSYKLRKTIDSGNIPPAISNHSYTHSNEPQKASGMSEQTCEQAKPRDNSYTPCQAAEMVNLSTDKSSNKHPPVVTNLDPAYTTGSQFTYQEMDAILCPFTQTEYTGNEHRNGNVTDPGGSNTHEGQEHSTPKKTTNENIICQSEQPHINISPILKSDESNTDMTYDSSWQDKMEIVAFTCDESSYETQSNASPAKNNKLHQDREFNLAIHMEQKATSNQPTSGCNTQLNSKNKSEQIFKQTLPKHTTPQGNHECGKRADNGKHTSLNPDLGTNTPQNSSQQVNNTASNEPIHTGNNPMPETTKDSPLDFNLYMYQINDTELRQIIEEARRGSKKESS